MLSLDSASVSIPSRSSPSGIDRVDLPMRAFAGGYYRKLKAMYDQLGLDYHSQPFLFVFSKILKDSNGFPKTTSIPYFIHSSNNHRFPPLMPHGMPVIHWIFEITYLLFFYTYFTVCCIFVRPHAGHDSETLQHYLTRLWLPQYFTTYYILPLMSSVTTCSHAELLQFPACDIIDYKRQTNGKQHYTLTNGVASVQDKLAEGIDTRFTARVLSVQPQASDKVKIQWRHSDDNHCLAPFAEEFDAVVLAVATDVVGDLFQPLKANMAKIPTIKVESTVHSNDGTIRTQCHALGKCRGNAQPIFLRTNVEMGQTESIHLQPSSVLVTTCPFAPVEKEYLLRSPAVFTRILRTPKSRQIVNEIFGEEAFRDRYNEDMRLNEKPKQTWRNGDDGVWLVGGWCWDGMVLLEGCIVSALRVANGLGVDAPF
jgi:hypothetical protein